MSIVMTSANPFSPENWVCNDVSHVGEFLLSHYPDGWPATARIYVGTVTQQNEVTPHDDASIAALESFEDPLWVVVYPGTGVEVAVTIGIVALIASVAAVLLIPDVPNIKTATDRAAAGQGSPNNSLSARDNQARPLQRIPDIYGGPVRAKPDVLSVPYTVYDSFMRQVEIGYYCVGVGAYTITLSTDVRDGDTPIAQIAGASAHVYGPGQAPTGVGPFSGPVLAIGDPILDPVLNVYQVNAVNGQVLEPFNGRRFFGAAKLPSKDMPNNAAKVTDFFAVMAFEYVTASTGNIYVPFSDTPDYVTNRTDVGDKLFLFLETVHMPSSSAPKPNLNTTNPSTIEPNELFADAMIVTSVSAFSDHLSILHVSIPVALQTQWALMPAYVAGLVSTPVLAGTFNSEWGELTPIRVDNLYTSPFLIDFIHPPGSSNITIICNFVAPNGLYIDDGVTLKEWDVQVAIRLTPCDVSGTPTGSSEFLTGTVLGSNLQNVGQRALTIRFTPSFQGRMLVSARRLDNRIRREELPNQVEFEHFGQDQQQGAKTGDGVPGYTGNVVDEIHWTHCYTTSEPPNISFGDITTIQTQTIATAGAAAVQSRQLNVLVTRNTNTWNGSAFVGPLVPNNQVENVVFSIMKDEFIGNRPDAQIDFVGIALAAQQVRDYFNDFNTGTPAVAVGYTFDDFNISFEETFTLLANLAFCTAFRQGNVLRMRPEVATEIAGGLFNHRNIAVGSQKITNTFGPSTENDSVEVDYVDPFDNVHTKVTVPVFGNLISPTTLRVPGLITRRHAFWHAYRAYQKMTLQRQALEMQTTQEAATLIVKDRILVADTTVLAKSRQTGNVIAVSGLSLLLSQNPTFVGGKTYTIFLMYADGTFDTIGITAGTPPYQVLLSGAPFSTIITDPTVGVPTLYNIIADDDTMPIAYLVSEQTAQNNMVFNVSGINYSNMYYFGDSLDFWVKNTLIDYSPKEYIINSTSISTGVDVTRGTMLSNAGSGNFVTDPSTPDIIDTAAGYTIAAWVKNAGALGYVGICQTQIPGPADDVLFGFLNNDLCAGHGNAISVTTPVPLGVIHHVAVTYNFATTFLSLYVDGILKASVSGVAAPHIGFHVYLKNYNGLIGDLMRWKRTWSSRAIFELYRNTKL